MIETFSNKIGQKDIRNAESDIREVLPDLVSAMQILGYDVVMAQVARGLTEAAEPRKPVESKYLTQTRYVTEQLVLDVMQTQTDERKRKKRSGGIINNAASCSLAEKVIQVIGKARVMTQAEAKLLQLAKLEVAGLKEEGKSLSLIAAIHSLHDYLSNPDEKEQLKNMIKPSL